jgi:hypothetical protein
MWKQGIHTEFFHEGVFGRGNLENGDRILRISLILRYILGT